MEAGDPFQPLSRNRVPATAVPAEPRGQHQWAVPRGSSNVGCWVLSETEPETNPGSPEWTACQGCPLSLCPQALCSVSARASRRPSSVQSPAWHPEPLHLSPSKAVCRRVSQIGASCQLGPGPIAQGLQAERGHDKFSICLTGYGEPRLLSTEHARA